MLKKNSIACFRNFIFELFISKMFIFFMDLFKNKILAAYFNGF